MLTLPRVFLNLFYFEKTRSCPTRQSLWRESKGYEKCALSKFTWLVTRKLIVIYWNHSFDLVSSGSKRNVLCFSDGLDQISWNRWRGPCDPKWVPLSGSFIWNSDTYQVCFFHWGRMHITCKEVLLFGTRNYSQSLGIERDGRFKKKKKKAGNMKCIILTIITHTMQWHLIHSQCSATATITSTHFQNIFAIPKGNSILTK